MLWKRDKLFCEISPLTYAISEHKEIAKRHLKNMLSKEVIARSYYDEKLPHVIYQQSSHLIKRGKGIDPTLQQNKAENIRLACEELNGLMIRPGETFSFWLTVGPTTKSRGYKDGRVIINGKLISGIGGGLCNLSNTIHRVVLHSPLEVTEFHAHSDALAPDEHGRVPFSAGTSVSYNYIDYRFKNTTSQFIQLLAWCEGDELFVELRSRKPFPCRYDISEEDHHFRKESDKYYRVSKIYKDTYDKKSGKLLLHQLVLDNHSEVMFDYDLIPKDQIRED